MYKWKRRVFASLLVMAMVLSPLSGPGFYTAAAVSGGKREDRRERGYDNSSNGRK